MIVQYKHRLFSPSNLKKKLHFCEACENKTLIEISWVTISALFVSVQLQSFSGAIFDGPS
jgi:hypothetical protein